MTETQPSKIKTFVEPDQMITDCAINLSDLDGAFIAQSSLVAYYASRHADAIRQSERLKLMLEVTEARAAKTYREEALAAGEKTTEARISQEVTLNTTVVKARMALIDARQVTDVLKGACDSLRQKRDMLIQLGVDRRDERRGDARLNDIDEASKSASRALSDRAKVLTAG
jgi:hypothetical protein